MHSVKNRFLMRIKNITPRVYWKNFFSITFRDLVVLSARDDATLRQVAGDLLAILRRDRPRLVDVGHTLRLRRCAGRARGSSPALSALLSGRCSTGRLLGTQHQRRTDAHQHDERHSHDPVSMPHMPRLLG